MDKLEPETIVSQAANVISREIDGHLVLLTASSGTVHELDEVGSYIWSLCATPVSIASMTEKVVAEYDVKKNEAEEDLASFIAELIELGAVNRQ